MPLSRRLEIRNFAWTMRNRYLFTLFFLIPILTRAQELSGRWTGRLTQEGKSGAFAYQLDLQQDGDKVSGVSFSTTADGGASARFELTGVWDGRRLVLQEIRQTEPTSPKWCLKYATLELSRTDKGLHLEGDWRAPGCTPGRLVLEQQATISADTLEQELPFTMTGTWTGHLSQSDRDYGFYFELEIGETAGGASFIVSEDNGGSARHALQWQYNESGQELTFRESAVVERTDPRWKWCIKSATLRRRREGGRYILEGNWQGYIEGSDPASARARCAPGKLYLEKPVLTRRIIQQTQQQAQAYTAGNARQIKVERVLEVHNRNLRLRVWDNGAVDGDVCTIFLNGERLLSRYRVSKYKMTIPVTLKEESNFLILHAEDLGNIPPNTVAVSVDDGVKEQVIILSSNLNESGAVMIREFKVE